MENSCNKLADILHYVAAAEKQLNSDVNGHQCPIPGSVQGQCGGFK